jgi:DNA-binding response OmpR family regulator
MRKKILVVEDDTNLLEIMRLALKSAGYSIASATNGIEALKKARTLLPDLIVLDLVLPELDGFAVCETLRRDRNTASVPIIVVTGLSSEFTRLAGFESGATDYVTKPVSPAELVSKIDAWLRRAAKPSPAQGRPKEKTPEPPACVH